MSAEARIKTILGEQLFQIVWLTVELEKAKSRIVELEALVPKTVRPKEETPEVQEA